MTELPWRNEGNHESCFYGRCEYAYGHVTHKSTTSIPPCIEKICQKINCLVSSRNQVNSVLCNLYKTGNHALGWHADDEQVLGKRPDIFSLSLGATRMFQLKDEKERITEVHLAAGSLLYMGGDTQQHWRHRILRQPNICLARINLTFRKIVS